VLHGLRIGGIHHQGEHPDGTGIHHRHQILATGLEHPSIDALVQPSLCRPLPGPWPLTTNSRAATARTCPSTPAAPSGTGSRSPPESIRNTSGKSSASTTLAATTAW